VSKQKWFHSYVEDCLRKTWGRTTLEPDSDGDYAFRHGTACGYVRVQAGPPRLVRVFAYAAIETPRSAKLLTELNDIDGRCCAVSVSWYHGAVLVEHVLLAEGVKPKTLRVACKSVGGVADDIGAMIAAVYGGKTPFTADDAEMPRAS
jgi:hypothetical protein